MEIFRKRITHSIFHLAMVIPIILSVSLWAGETVRIMPLGDSITQDSSESDPDLRDGYRNHLWYLLSDGNYTIDFVGAQSEGIGVTPSFDPDHAGYRGNSVANIRDGEYNVPLHADHPGLYQMLVDQYANDTPPDVILLHIGTNRVQEVGRSTVKEVEDLLELVDDFEQDYNQSVEVLVARIIDYNVHNPDVTSFNNDVEAMLGTRPLDSLLSVNMETGANINYATDMADEKHPNDIGYQKMADLWYESLQAVIPVHQWNLDETMSTTFLDRYRDAEGSCTTGCPSPTIFGKFDNAQDFNDTAIGGIDINDASNINWDANQSFTIEMWINTNSVGATAHDGQYKNNIIMGRTDENNDFLWFLGINKDNGQFIFDSDDTVTSINNVADGLWHHVVCVRDASTSQVSLYIDGQIQETKSATSRSFNGGTAPLTIGSFTWGVGYEYNGMLDHLTIYNGALSTDKIKRHYDLATRDSILVDHYWKLDEFSGQTSFIDKYSSETSGTCSGINCPDYRAVSQVNHGRTFKNDENDSITIPDSESMDWGADQNFTIELWMKPYDISPIYAYVALGRLGAQGAAGNMNWWIGIDVEGKAKIHFEDRNGNAPVTIKTSTPINVSEWYHVAVVREAGSTFKFYINGQEVASAPDTTEQFYASTPTRIGHFVRADNTETIQHFEGILDDIIIFRSALSPEYIEAHYNKGLAGLAYDELDDVSPIITLVGNSSVTFEAGTNYNDAGATAIDNVDGDITDKITIFNPVDIYTAGTYTITYDVVDFAGNPATEVTRTVTVTDTVNPIVYEVSPVSSPTSNTTPNYVFNSNEYGTISYAGGCTSNVTNAVAGDNNITFDTLVDGNYTGCTIMVTDSAGNPSNTLQVTPFVIDILPPTLTEITPVPSPTADTTPDYTFSSSEAGTIEYIGDCNSSTTAATAGTNTITFAPLSVGQHGNCVLRVTDAASNEYTELNVSTFVVDNIAPTITRNGDETINLLVNQTYIEAGATCVDNYDTNCSVMTGGDIVDTSSVGTYSVIYNATDTAGNSATTVTRTVHVTTGASPVITVHGDNPFTIEVNTPFFDPGVSANDLEDGTNLTITTDVFSSINTGVLGEQMVTYTATDSQNNVTEANRTVIVVDTIKPDINLTGNSTVNLLVFATYTEEGATCTDNYDPTCTVSIGGDTVNTSITGTYIVTYDVNDSEGNSADTVTRTVTVSDTTIPAINLIGDNPQVIEASTPYQELGATANDNYDGDITAAIVIDSSDVNTSAVGNYTVTYDVNDSSNNKAVQVTRDIHVVDTVKPTILLIGNNTINIEVGTPYNDAGATANDNIDGNITASIETNSTIDMNVTGTYTVTYNVQDLSGNPAIQVTRTVIVEDTTKPIITLIGSNAINLLVNQPYTEQGANCTDNYDVTCNVTISGGPVDTSSVGSYLLTYTATDIEGNAADPVIRFVNIATGYPPQITVLGDNPFTVEYNNPYQEPGVSADDVEDGTNLSITSDANTSIDISILGTQTVTYTVIDSQDNVAEANRTVFVVDTTKPVITLTGSDTVNLLVSGTYTEEGATCTDNYDSTCTVTIGGDVVDTSSVGTYVITYNVTDTQGNTADTVTRTVTVSDTTIPVITLLGDNPQVLEVSSVYQELGATASDNVDGDITNQITIDTSSVDMNTLGTYTVTYDVNDSSNNEAIQITREVQVVDTTRPVITLNGTNSVNLLVGQSYTEQGATCTDNYDTSCNVIFSGIVDTSTIGSYQVTYTAVDLEGNQAIPWIRTVNVTAGNAPVITVSGDNPLILEVNATYVEPGVSALDPEDGTRTVFSDFFTAIDTSVEGTQILTYFSTDSDGNTALATRTVVVGNPTYDFPYVKNDFNEDGNSDILFIQDNNATVVWLMNETGKIGQINVIGDKGWTVHGSGDFNNDDHADILFKTNTGSYIIWLMNETGKIGQINVMGDIGWSVEHTGDFNKDGYTDILFKTNTGGYTIWFMNGTGKIGELFLMGNRGWSADGVGDFNKDGFDDILFKRHTGAYSVMLINETGEIGTISVMGDIGWTADNIGDFNNDGYADILFKKDNGAYVVWLMNPTGKIGAVAVMGDRGWTAQNTGDFNNDGHADILFKKDNGAYVIWLMDETGKIDQINVMSDRGWNVPI